MFVFQPTLNTLHFLEIGLGRGWMIEFVNVVVAAVAGFVLGLAVHSAYLHSRKRGGIGRASWNRGEAGQE